MFPVLPPNIAKYSDAPSSSFVSPTRYVESPACLKSIVIAFVTSGMTPSAEISSVGIAEIFTGSPSAVYPEKSLNMESLPEINGVPYAVATSKQARVASFNSYRRSGVFELDQQKLSKIANPPAGGIREAPAQMAFLIAVSIEAAAILYVSTSEYHGASPCASTIPREEFGSGCSTVASAFTRT